jgi:hypothetical protein
MIGIEPCEQKDIGSLPTSLSNVKLPQVKVQGRVLPASGNHQAAHQRIGRLASSLKRKDADHLIQIKNGVKKGHANHDHEEIEKEPEKSALETSGRLNHGSLIRGREANTVVTFRRLSKTKIMFPLRPASPTKQVPHAFSGWTSFQGAIHQRSSVHLLWYFRTSVHMMVLLLVVALCCCVWLFPQLFCPDLPLDDL